MCLREDITGKKFGRLTVKEFLYKQNKCNFWKCICDCGNEIVVRQKDLRRGHTKSCGCYQRERAKEANTKHNLVGSKIYNTYLRMKQRCFDKNCERYKNYGGRGVTICDEWLDKENGFINFYNWAYENGYNENLSIDRIDVNGNYEPSNCRWITMEEQARNKTNTIRVEYENEILTLKDLCRKLNLNYKTIWNRLKSGYDLYKAINTPIRKSKTSKSAC